MNSRVVKTVVALCGIASGVAWLCGANAGTEAPEPIPQVTLERVPAGGIQPQIAVGTDGTVHLVYYTGDPRAGDLFYCRRERGQIGFSEPVRVNKNQGSAIAAGTIRGAQLAVGRGDRLHVLWNGSKSAKPRGPNDETPLLYTRWDAARGAFEPERNVIGFAYGLDGGGCLAADREGRVFIAWHAGSERDESARRVWLTRSEDDGATLAPERAIDDARAGACGCCAMRASASPRGDLMLLYRSAREDVNRDMYLLISRDQGITFDSHELQEWTINACPMSTAALAHAPAASWGAWETSEQIYYARLNREPSQAPRPLAMPGMSRRRKHPVLAVNPEGQVLLVATEGTDWNRGGGLIWQLLDDSGRPTSTAGASPGIPAWSFAAAFSQEDGSFVIVY